MLHHETQFKLNETVILDAAKAGAHVGYCLACGHNQPCDPMTCNAKCQHCHLRQVYGVQQIVLHKPVGI